MNISNVLEEVNQNNEPTPIHLVPSIPKALSPALAYLNNFDQFIIWNSIPDEDGAAKPRKVPCDYRTGYTANAHNPRVWTNYDTASGTAARFGKGYHEAFTLTRETHVALLDFDNAKLPDGTWHPTVAKIMSRFPEAADEVSYSTQGRHGWIRYKGDLDADDITTVTIEGLTVELFLAKKFIALGDQTTATGDLSKDYTVELTDLIAEYFPKKVVKVPIPAGDVRPATPDEQRHAKYLFQKAGDNFAALGGGDGNGKILTLGVTAGGYGATECFSVDFAEEVIRAAAEVWYMKGGRRKWCDVKRTFMNGYAYGFARPLYPSSDVDKVGFGKAELTAEAKEYAAQSQATASVAEHLKRRKLKIIKVSEVDSEPIDWAWEDWLPKSMLTLYAGVGGVGKSTVTLNIASTLSNGGKWPDGTECPKGRVVIWSGEDVVKYTIRPRLEAMGANLDMIDVIAGVEQPGAGDTCFDPARDGELIREAYGPGSIALLIVDPLISTVAGDMNQSNQVRRSLQYLVDFAEEVGCAIIGLAHFTKGSDGKNPVERILGSGAFGHVARMVWMGGQDESTKECAIVKGKTNIVLNSGGFKYKIEPRQFLNRKGQQIKTTGIHWLEALEGSAREILSALEPDTGRGGGGKKLQRTKDAFLQMLGNGPRPMTEVEKGLPDVSDFTIKQARRELGIVSNSILGIQWWALPEPTELTPGLTHQVRDGKIVVLPDEQLN